MFIIIQKFARSFMNHPQVTQINKYVMLWLVICLLMVILMVGIGGYTRLSGSGLSITEWKPVSGITPPFGESGWLDEFSKYKNSPEFKKVNFDFTLSDFKQIYLVEYFHRLVGRLTGFIFIIPFLFFIWRKMLKPKHIYLLSTIFLLSALQGACGWYMVKSGLASNPHVSHFRLALHLGLALLIFSMLLWCFLSYKNSPQISAPSSILYLSLFTTFILFTQIMLGAFVAGLKGGLIYNSFPLMNCSLIPDEVYFHGLFNLSSPAIVQFFHRVFGFIALFLILFLTFNIFHKKLDQRLGKRAILLTIACIAQIILGILTLIKIVPLELALLHQLLAFIVFSLAIYLVFPIYLALCIKSQRKNHKELGNNLIFSIMPGNKEL